MRKKSDIRYNGDGYYDPTPFEAIKTIDKGEKKRAGILVKTIQEIAHLSGFDIEGRIAVRSHKTGEIYK